MKVNIKQAIDYVVANTPDKTQISSNIEFTRGLANLGRKFATIGKRSQKKNAIPWTFQK